VKRVHYLTGAALMPAAMGLALPVAANAATTGPTHTGATHTGAKTVSLRHSGIRLARESTAAISSDSPQISEAGCHGNTNVKLSRVGNVKGQLWYANSPVDFSTCIGTVDASLYFAHTYCKSAGVSITTSPAGIGSPGVTRTAKVCGTKGQWTKHAFGIHEDFSHLPHVSGVVVEIWSQYGGPTGTKVGS
jgi:hypothetical protein